MRYDLHAHSHYSDGTLAPAMLVAHARAAGVDVLALTDHDCIDGLAEAGAAALASGLLLVPGVEISVSWREQTVHILGLGIDPDEHVLTNGLTGLAERRRERAREIAGKLARRRIMDAYDGAASLAGGAIIGRAHFARFLVRQGYVRSSAQAFKQYLLRGGAAYVPGRWATLTEAVGWITGAGGQAVVAHPTRYQLSNRKLRELLAEFKDGGGAGIEVVCGGQPPSAIAHAAALATEFGLLASVGSDYHGPEQTWIEPGRLAPLPPECSPIWRRLAGGNGGRYVLT